MKLSYPRLILALLAFFGISACVSKAPQSANGFSLEGTKHLRLIHIADTHGQLNTHPDYLPEDPDHLHQMGGYARLKTAIDQLRQESVGPSFSADGGDTFQGSALAAWTKGEAVIGPLNSLHLDVGTPGNWEVVYGPDVFQKLMNEVNFKVLAVNYMRTSDHQRLFKPYALIERGGVKVAFFGMTDPTTTQRQPPAEVVGLDSTDYSELKGLVAKVKAEEKPDLIVLVSHQGLAPSVELAKEIPDLNVLLSGHTHERTYKPILVGSTIVIEPGSMGSFISSLDLSVKDGKIVDSNYRLVNVEADTFAEDRDVAAMIKAAEKPYRERLDTVIGSTKNVLLRYDVLEATMDNLVSDAVREATHADIGFTNGFRFSPPIPPGPLTQADLWNILPLDTRIKVGKVTGAQLRKYFEHELELVFAKDPYKLSGGWGPRPSGMQMVFKAKAPEGQRLVDLKIGGKKVDEKKVYTIAGCEREGEEMDIVCRLKGVKDTKYFPLTVHKALERYIKRHSPLALKNEKRAVALDLPEKIWSQYKMLQTMWDLPGQADAMDYTLDKSRQAPK